MAAMILFTPKCLSGDIYPVWEAPKSTFSNFFSIKTFRQLNNRYVVKQQYNH